MNNHTEYYNEGRRYTIGIKSNKGRIFAPFEINTKDNTSRVMDELGDFARADEAQKVLDDYAAVVGWKTCTC